MKSEQRFRLRYIIYDYLAVNMSWLVFTFVRYCLTKDFGAMREIDAFTTYLSFHDIVLGQILFPFLIVFICLLSGFYNKPFSKPQMQVFLNTVVSSFFASMVVYFAILINDNLPERNINYELICSLWLIIGTALYIPRKVIANNILRHIKNGDIRFNTLVIGDKPTVAQVLETITKSRDESGAHVVGTLAFDDNMADLDKTCKALDVQSIIIAPSNRTNSETLHLINDLFHLAIPIKIAPETYDIITSNIRHANIIGEPFVNIAQSNMPEWQKNVKRMFDICISATALVVLAPVFAAIAFAIKKDSKGSIIYSQERIGKNGKPFHIYKFRTMVTNAESGGVPMLSNEEDKRITKIGHTLRKYRLDETPQFWNVLKGDMSLVGPRPERKFFAEQIIERAPYYTLTYQIRPGITSWGMVKYGYAKNVDEMIERSKYDLIYLDNMSLFVDFKIILYTVRTVLTGKGM